MEKSTVFMKRRSNFECFVACSLKLVFVSEVVMYFEHKSSVNVL